MKPDKQLFEKHKDWLIGFFEAVGFFSIDARGELSFVITQGYRNIAVLYRIREIMGGIGTIQKQGPKTFRYNIQDQKGLETIIEIINGNLVLDKRIFGLELFIAAYNERYSKSIKINKTRRVPTRKDGWLSGFVDGYGCFNIGYVATKDTFPIRFIISQKEDIERIREVTGGSMEKNKTNQCNSIVIKDIPGSLGKNTNWVLEYFNEFRLLTTKWNSFIMWGYIRERLLKENLSPQQKEGLKQIIKLINQNDPTIMYDVYIPQEDGEKQI